ncbi:Transcriptional regulator, TetR family [Actinokineospora spheciospongiae]|uniref:Transcriptional regulator, TetR family n=1 Tax=Actinokineospora spheciospongiae TaxID=909613 RepID=W7JF35_9PSEU|nr:TetR/AcrR family transcriptional regulator [Actinokineospora spheciospongiae]EWC64619.1 Transcriptional regulator, TetR family [Actinokineospora spheciospongiae]
MPRVGLNTAKVVQEAAEIADSEGLESLTLARLASELGIRVPSLYKHINGLADLHRRLAAIANESMAEAIRGATVGRAGTDALRACCRSYREFAGRYPGRYAAAQRAPDPNDPDQAALHKLSGELTSLALNVLRSYDLVGEDSIHAARILRSAMHGFVSLEQLGGFGLPTEIEASFERLIDLLDAGLRAMAAQGSTPTT